MKHSDFKFTYGHNKHVTVRVEADPWHVETIQAAITAHVRLEQFWVTFANVLTVFVPTMGMAWYGNIGPHAALILVSLLSGILLIRFHNYGSAADKIDGLLRGEKSE